MPKIRSVSLKIARQSGLIPGSAQGVGIFVEWRLGPQAGEPDLVACAHCDLLIEAKEPAHGHVAVCPRCASSLYRSKSGSLDYPLALHVTALVLFFMANTFPFITFKMEGRD